MPEKEESVKEFVTRNLGEEARRSTKPQDGPGRDQAGWRGGQVSLMSNSWKKRCKICKTHRNCNKNPGC